VAAGEGAFLTWRMRFPASPTPPSNTKSSTRFPPLSTACALTQRDGILYKLVIFQVFLKQKSLYSSKCTIMWKPNRCVFSQRLSTVAWQTYILG
jgi:hypothetical protein